MSNCVKYMGLNLNSPIIVSSCSLTADPQKVKQMEEYGAGAVVVKSLFEEQIRNEVDFLSQAGDSHTEMGDYLHNYVRQSALWKYTKTIRDLKSIVKMPVIASINCYTAGEWVEYAKEIEKAGADALEVNLYDLATDPVTSPEHIEAGYCTAVRKVVNSVKIPVAVKIGSHLTSIANFVGKLVGCGAKGVVMFNRFFAPDIDIDNFSLRPSAALSHESEYREVLRWTAIVSSVVKGIDISTTTGVHSSESMIKEILAGAETVQICSVLYKKGLSVISDFNKDLAAFLEKNNLESPEQMRGRLNYSNIKDPAMYERVQFLKTFGNMEENMQ